MRKKEKNYEFRAVLDEVHGKIGWDRNEKPLADEIAIDG